MAVLLSSVDQSALPSPAIYGLSGAILTPEEKKFFRDSNPLGFILFGRNCADPEQLRALNRSLQDLLGREVPILIDQEGGRVQRLRAPQWKEHPAAKNFGDLHAQDAGKARGDLAANTASLCSLLRDNGFNVNCTPVMDVLFPQTHAAIGNRAFSGDPAIVAELGGVVCEACFAGGVVPIVKHLPGLGRADLDTHYDLPTVKASRTELELSDFAAFRLSGDTKPVWGMVGHAIYDAVDPGVPASCSPLVIRDIIRGFMGLEGLMLSDDLCMEALAIYGGAGARAAKSLAAGCDIALHCNGKMEEMIAVANSIPQMTKDAAIRYNCTVSTVKNRFESA